MKQLLITIVALVLVGCGKSQKELNNELINSLNEGVFWRAKKAIESGANVNSGSFFSPLGLAAGKEDERMVNLLLNNGAKLRSDTELIGILNTGNKRIIKQLINGNINFNIDGINGKNGDTPLRWAIRYNANEIVNLLVDNGVDINTNVNGFTLLHDAATKGDISIMELLIDKGLDVNAISDLNKTPLDSAIGYLKGPMSNPKDQEAKILLLRKHGGKTGEELKAEGK